MREEIGRAFRMPGERRASTLNKLLVMRRYLDAFFVFISCAVSEGTAFRIRVQFACIYILFFLAMIMHFNLLNLLSISIRGGGFSLIPAMAYSWLLGKVVDPYVDKNWRLFSVRTRNRNPHLALLKTGAFLFFLAAIIGMGFSGYFWAKRMTRVEAAQTTQIK